MIDWFLTSNKKHKRYSDGKTKLVNNESCYLKGVTGMGLWDGDYCHMKPRILWVRSGNFALLPATNDHTKKLADK